MENYEEKWNECLAMIRERVTARENGERTYKVWFADITIDSYDGTTVVLRVPSRYVVEYLEMYCTRMLSEVLTAAFGPDTHLAYHVVAEFSFEQATSAVNQAVAADGPLHFTMGHARKRLEDGLHYYLKGQEKWLPAYDKVVDWLSDNKGRGLLCVGTTGLGKSLICYSIFRVLFLDMKAVFVTAQQMNDRIDDLLKPDTRIIVIDDLGKEAVETRTYGNRRTPFFELCDAAERDGKLLIITTNLSTTPVNDARYPASIQQRYGDAVISRLRGITKVVIFEGEDLRG